MIYKNNLSGIILGGDYYGSLVSEKDVYKLLDTFYFLGGNNFDTARMYTDGVSEIIYGKWIKTKPRDSVFIATKGGHPDLVTGKKRLLEKEVEEDLNKSLKAMGLDFVDLYYLHRDDEDLPEEYIIEYLNKFKKEGKIKNIGVSNWKAKRIKKANEYALKHGLTPITFSQIKYSLTKTSPFYQDDATLVEMNDTEYNLYKDLNINVTCFAPQAKGFFSKLENVGESGLDDKTRQRYLCEENVTRYQKVKKIAENYNISVGAVSILYLLSNKDFNTFPVIGCKTVSQLEDTLDTKDIILTPEDIYFLGHL